MIRALALLMLTACTSFPQVDAAAPTDSGARPALLTAAQFSDVVTTAQNAAAPPLQDDAALRMRAQALRER